jgi:DNA-directed RNA polymerase alpha subunit
MKFTIGKYYRDEVSETLHYKLSNTTNAEANAMRRVFLSNVQCLAIHNLQFTTCKCSFPEEMIKRRIENIHVLNTPDLTEGQVFTLDVKCPPDVALYDVTANHIKGLENCINQSILITSLKPGQEIKLKFELVKGSSIIHNKWSVVAGFDFYPTKELALEDISASEEYEMSIETTNIISPIKILTDTCDILINKLQSAKVKDEELKLRVTKIGEEKNVIIIPNDHHTVAGMVTRRMLMRETDVYKAAYKVPDPLKPNSEIHIAAINPLEIYHEIIDELQEIFTNLKKQISGVGPNATKGGLTLPLETSTKKKAKK